MSAPASGLTDFTEELVLAEAFRGSRRLIRSWSSSHTLRGFSSSLSVDMLRACLNSCPPTVGCPSPAAAALQLVWAPGVTSTVPGSGVFLPWGRGMVMLPRVDGSERSGPRIELSGLVVRETICSGSLTDGRVSQTGFVETGITASSYPSVHSLL